MTSKLSISNHCRTCIYNVVQYSVYKYTWLILLENQKNRVRQACSEPLYNTQNLEVLGECSVRCNQPTIATIYTCSWSRESCRFHVPPRQVMLFVSVFSVWLVLSVLVWRFFFLRQFVLSYTYTCIQLCV